MRDISTEEIRGVLAATEEKKYRYFISSVVGGEEVWGMRGKHGWLFEEIEEGIKAMPLWPAREFMDTDASVDAARKKGYVPSPISIYEFIAGWIPHLTSDGLAVALCGDHTLWMKESIQRLKSDLEEAIAES
jgi:hypothetical protein